MEDFPARVASIDQAPLPGEARDAWRLADGTAIMLRAVRPDDGERMQALIQGLSMQSRYRRFFYPIHQLERI